MHEFTHFYTKLHQLCTKIEEFVNFQVFVGKILEISKNKAIRAQFAGKYPQIGLIYTQM